jgi:tripartite-type tricarboxylate transporter receptor subunit TctC
MGRNGAFSRRAFAVVLAIGCMSAAGAAAEDAWPTRPVRLIVPQAAGGAPDIIARLIGNKLGPALGQQIVIENRTGAGNIIGAQAAARAAPDGYTFLFAPAALLVSNPYTFKSLPYDPVKDFTPVGMIAKGPFMLLANPELPVHDLAEVLALDKREPNKLTIAVDGPKQFSAILAAWLNKLGKARLAPVSYPSMPQGVQDAVAGRVPLIILAIPAAAPRIKAGMLRPLAISWPRSVPQYPDVKPMADTFPGIDISGWFVIVAPKGTPAAIIDKLNRELDKVVRDPEVKSRMETLGFYSDGAGTPADTAAFIKAQYESWGAIIHAVGIQPE